MFDSWFVCLNRTLSLHSFALEVLATASFTVGFVSDLLGL